MNYLRLTTYIATCMLSASPLLASDSSKKAKNDDGRAVVTMTPQAIQAVDTVTLGKRERDQAPLSAAGDLNDKKMLDDLFGFVMQGADNASQSLSVLVQQAESGNTQACFLMARLYSTENKAVQKDLDKAIEWLDRPCCAKSVSSLTFKGKLHLQLQHYHEAFEILSAACEIMEKAGRKDCPDAWHQLGRMHNKGLGRGINGAEAAKLFLKAAEQNHLEAALELAFLHFGRTDERAEKYVDSIQYLQLAQNLFGDKDDAASKKISEALKESYYQLSVCYERQAVSASLLPEILDLHEKGLQNLMTAADLGHAGAKERVGRRQLELSDLYNKYSKPTRKEEFRIKEQEWLLKALDSGCDAAKKKAEAVFVRYNGPHFSNQVKIDFFEKLAVRGFKAAQNELPNLYLSQGRYLISVGQYQAADVMLTNAAQKGKDEAWADLGDLALKMDNQDKDKAIACYKEAAAHQQVQVLPALKDLLFKKGQQAQKPPQPDFNAAITCYKDASTYGSHEAIQALSQIYLNDWIPFSVGVQEGILAHLHSLRINDQSNTRGLLGELMLTRAKKFAGGDALEYCRALTEALNASKLKDDHEIRELLVPQLLSAGAHLVAHEPNRAKIFFEQASKLGSKQAKIELNKMELAGGEASHMGRPLWKILDEQVSLCSDLGHIEEEVNYLKAAVAAGSPQAQYRIAKDLVEAPEGQRNDPEAVRLLQLAVASGNRDAELLLANLYFEGRGVSGKKFAEAFEIYHKHKEFLGAEENFHLGNIYRLGLVPAVAANLDLALQHFQLAYQQGNAQAGYYYAALSETQAPHTAFQLISHYESAAKAGIPEAQARLGFMYETGKGKSLDLKKAEELYRQAAAKGVSEAHRQLGLMYNKGQIPTQSPEAALVEASTHFRAAYDKDDLAAGYQLGRIYHKQGNTNQAIAIIRNVGLRGYRPAQLDLIGIYANANFHGKSIESLRWALLSNTSINEERLSNIITFLSKMPRSKSPVQTPSAGVESLQTYANQFQFLKDQQVPENMIFPSFQPGLVSLIDYVQQFSKLFKNLESQPILGTIYMCSKEIYTALKNPKFVNMKPRFLHAFIDPKGPQYLTIGSENVELVKDLENLMDRTRHSLCQDNLQHFIAGSMVFHLFWKVFKAENNQLACNILAPQAAKTYEIKPIKSYGDMLSYLELVNNCYQHASRTILAGQTQVIRQKLQEGGYPITDEMWNAMTLKVLCQRQADQDQILAMPQNPIKSIPSVCEHAREDFLTRLRTPDARNQAIVELPITQALATSFGVRKELGLPDEVLPQ